MLNQKDLSNSSPQESGNITSLPGNYDTGYGIIFGVHAKQRISITDLRFYAYEKTKQVYAQIYTIKGKHNHSQTKPLEEWMLIGNKIVVTRGIDFSTPFNNVNSGNNMNPVTMETGEFQTFYFSLSSEDLVYSKTNKKIDDVFLWNEDVSLIVGNAIDEDFFNVLGPRAWSGYLGYDMLAATDFPTLLPSHSPSMLSSFSPSLPNSSSPSLSHSPSTIQSSIPSLSFEPSISVVPSIVSSQGPSKSYAPTFVPPTSLPSVLPSVSPTYILEEISINHLFIFNGNNLTLLNSESKYFLKNKIQEILHGKFSQNIIDFHNTSVIIVDQFLLSSYFVEVGIEVTSSFHSPTIQVDESYYSSLVDSCINDDIFKLFHQLKENTDIPYFRNIHKIVSMLTPPDFSDYHNILGNQTISLQSKEFVHIMDRESILYFESSFLSFLPTFFDKFNPTTQIKIVTVTHQMLSLNNGYPFLNIYILVQGKYLPPPYYDFFSQLQSYINDKSEILIRQLRESGVPIFQHVDSISSQETTDTVLPAHSSIYSSFLSFLPPFFDTVGGYVLLGFCALIVLSGFIKVICVVYNYFPNRSSNKQVRLQNDTYSYAHSDLSQRWILHAPNLCWY